VQDGLQQRRRGWKEDLSCVPDEAVRDLPWCVAFAPGDGLAEIAELGGVK
jgi:hypothetical protein